MNVHTPTFALSLTLTLTLTLNLTLALTLTLTFILALTLTLTLTLARTLTGESRALRTAPSPRDANHADGGRPAALAPLPRRTFCRQRCALTRV